MYKYIKGNSSCIYSVYYLFFSQGLQPFSPHKASGQRLLQSVLKGDLSRTDIYWAHAPLSREEKSAVVLITDR